MRRRTHLLALAALGLLLASARAHEGHHSDEEESEEDSTPGAVAPRPVAPDPALLTIMANAPHTDVLLGGGKLSLAWLVRGDNITFIVQSLDAKTPVAAVGFGIGTRMQNLSAYIGWMDGGGKGHVRNYHIAGVKAESVKPTAEPIRDVQVFKKNGLISYTFTRSLNGSGTGDMKSVHLDVSGKTLTPVMWALFPTWSVKDPAKDSPAPKDVHFAHAKRVNEIDFSSGIAKLHALPEGSGFTQKHLAHGVLMALAWGVLFPASAMSVRFLRARGGPTFFKVHLALNLIGFVFTIAAFGLIYDFKQKHGEDHFATQHAKLGLSVFILFWFQPLNGLLRPHPPKAGSEPTTTRRLWEYFHRGFGRFLVCWGIFVVLTGLNTAMDMGSDAGGWRGIYIAWVLVGLLGGTGYLEYRRRAAAAAAVPALKPDGGVKSLSELVDMELQGLDSSRA